MNNWFKALLALLAGRDRTPRRTDWRGRPVGENTGGPIPSDTHPEGDLYPTLRLSSPAAGASHGDRAKTE
jgi:hypothetical protein